MALCIMLNYCMLPEYLSHNAVEPIYFSPLCFGGG